MPKQTWIPDTRNRLAERRAEKPATKAGQIWALWPEIKACLDSGQSLKTVRQWVEEDAGIVVSDRAFAMYVSRSRRKETAQRTAAAAEAFLRVHDQQVHALPTPCGEASVIPSIPPQQTELTPNTVTAEADPATRTVAALRKRRFDIRQVHRNGDPTDVKLI